MTKCSRVVLMMAILALIVPASAARAQVGFSIAGGPTFATGDAGDDLDMGYHLKGGAHLTLPGIPIGIQAEGMWTRFDFSEDDEFNFQVLNASLNAVIRMPTPGFTPYIIGGVGFYNSKMNVDAVEDSNDFGVNVGAGLQLNLPGLGAFVEARMHNVFGDGDSLRFIPVSIGLRM